MASKVAIAVERKGPFWSRGDEVRKGIEAASARTAIIAEAAVQTRLGEAIKHPTGAYQGAIRREKRRDLHVVTDGGVSYGPWLERGRTRGPGGTLRTTRFKGYRAFLRARNKAAKWLREETKREMARIVGRLN